MRVSAATKVPMTITSALESDLPFEDEVVSTFNNKDVSMGIAHITEDDSRSASSFLL